ncbi:MAG TPA: hypothetical protein DCM28_23195 [Phycisphaerales bacterium]|nr:hypothetical protein [Phycisphaerales bacterium]HCD32730.1 hypothetical protein [Phycisphaerales bacterium]|tara:strand:- start:1 stop:357 length:357 start_codon:yes stop_codon:yes gene_type:complete
MESNKIEDKQINRLKALSDYLFQIDDEFPARDLKYLLWLYQHDIGDGVPMSEFRTFSGLPGTTIRRFTLFYSGTMRRCRKIKTNWLTCKRDPGNDVKKTIRLTKEGRRAVEQILETLE